MGARPAAWIGLIIALSGTPLDGAGINASGDGSPPAAGLKSAINQTLPCVVKIYGAAISREHGYGVGVLVSPDGQIVTVSSLMLDARRIRVVLHDGREYQATLERRDENVHLALLKIDGSDLPHLTPNASVHLLPGDTLIAFGNSYKIAEGQEQPSVVRGAFSLRTKLKAWRRKQPFSYRGEVLLFDAVTSNPGMAGGPLIDIEGRWVGLIGKIVVSDLTNTYLSFAMPSEVVTAFLEGKSFDESAKADSASNGSIAGEKQRPYTGIRLFTMGFRRNAAYVDRVSPGSPAEASGLRTDDLILAIDGAPVKSASDFRRRMDRASPGQTLTLAVKRGEKVLSVELAVGVAP